MTSLAVQGIGQIAVYVHDLPSAVRFYREQLGLRYLFEAGGMAFFDVNGVRLMLSQPNAADPQQRASVLYFKVADIDHSWQALMAAGTVAREPPQQVYAAAGTAQWLAFFEDPSGNVMALMEERKQA
ncbi:VOC family protein [Permianibacter sp. IMCC34836]|uniref:VOC family protein n=1 Tax=Permianibacter fluminis TaxID=2738515 RepID=UPI0015519857|nr:VOC family protein [Permianibacter fluminis]NQD35854.1 VOC family protein [Permianibacter fluminis]